MLRDLDASRAAILASLSAIILSLSLIDNRRAVTSVVRVVTVDDSETPTGSSNETGVVLLVRVATVATGGWPAGGIVTERWPRLPFPLGD